MKARDKADEAYDKSHGIKQGSKKDKALDKKNGVYKYEYGNKGRVARPFSHKKEKNPTAY